MTRNAYFALYLVATVMSWFVMAFGNWSAATYLLVLGCWAHLSYQLEGKR